MTKEIHVLKPLLVCVMYITGIYCLYGQNSRDNDIFIDCKKAIKIQEKINVDFSTEGIRNSNNAEAGYLISQKIKIPIKKFRPYLSFTIKSEVENLTDGMFAIYVRNSTNGKSWTNWDTLKAVDDVNQTNEEGGNSDFYICNTPISNLKAKYIQIMVVISNSNIVLKSLRLHFFSPGIFKNTTKVKSPLFQPSSCPCPALSFVTRAGWSCQQAENCPVYDPNSGANVTFTVTSVTNLVVHHAAGYGSAPYDARVRDIWDLHVNVNGWSDIAYNWIIAPDGVLYKGRAWNGSNDNIIGAHMCSCNSNKMGVCLLGDFTSTTPTSAAYNKLVSLLGWKACSWGITPNSSTSTSYNPSNTGCINGTLLNIIGHRDGCQQSPLYTDCPGSSFYPQLTTLRNDVQTFINNCNTATCTDNFEPNDSFTSATVVFGSPLGIGSSNYTLPGTNIGWAGDQDWFKVQLAACGALTITLSNLPYNYDLELYGPSGLGQWINGSYNTGTTNEQIVFTSTTSSLTTYYAKVYAANASNYTTASCYNINFAWVSSGAPSCSSLSGPTTGCQGLSQIYSASCPNATSYNWTVPSGWTINTGQGTSSINVNLGANSGQVCVTPSNSCGNGTQSCQSVTINQTPGTASISGLTSYCQNSSVNFTANASNATTYNWTVPSGWTINSGQGTASINFTVGANSGQVCVTPSNSCGIGTQICQSVTVNQLPGIANISGPTSLTQGQNYPYSVNSSNATTYNWTVPSGWTINSGQGTANINITVGANSGQVCVTPSNSCGNGTQVCQSVIVIGISEISSISEFQVYPNPTTGNFTLTLSLTQMSGVSVDLLSEKGDLVKTVIEKEQLSGKKSWIIDTSKLSNGDYLLEVVIGRQVVSKKLAILR